jgi:D-3-phosphoglycerate dehydrogenase
MEPLGISSDSLNELLAPLKDHEIVIHTEKTIQPTELLERAKDADVLVIANNPLPGEVIRKCDKLKMISVAFVGVDHVDIEACKEKNILISNAAGYCTHAVAELAIGLTLSVLRNIPRGDHATRQLRTKDGLVGNELYKKTFGIIGTGEIGLQTARIASAFGCKVIAYSRTEKEEAKLLGIEYKSLEDVLKEADIVSLHTPLTAHTKHLIDADKLNLMKASSILINTARGPIVDNKHLSDLLHKGKIAGAGIDVFDVEPPLSTSDALISNETAVLTPHVAYATYESILRRASIVINNISGWLENKPQNVMLD